MHNQLLRNIKKLPKNTPIFLLYAELGRKPLDIHIKSGMIGYWISLVNSENTNKFFRKIYDIMLAECNRGQNFKWLIYIKQILISVAEPGLLYQNVIQFLKATKEKIVNRLNDLYTQECATKLQSTSKGRNYSILKQTVKTESYFTTLPRNVYTCIPIVKFRTCNYNLSIKTGRWHDVPLNERKCTLCNQTVLGDDFHYLLKCTYFEVEQNSFSNRTTTLDLIL